MSRHFLEKLDELELAARQNPDDLQARFDYNMALLRSGAVDPDWVLENEDDVIRDGDVSLPLIEVLLHHDQPYYSHGLRLLRKIDSDAAREKLDHAVERLKNPKKNKATNKDLYGEEKSKKQLEKCKSNLKSEKEKVRDKAAMCIGEHFSAESVRILEDLLYNDPSDQVRETALWYYAYQRAERHFDDVMSKINYAFSRDYNRTGFGLGAYWNLIELGYVDDPQLKSKSYHVANLARYSPDWETRRMAVFILDMIMDRYDAIFAALDDEHHSVREQAARILGEVNYIQAKSKLEEMLKNDPKKIVRSAAKRSWKGMG